MNRLIVNGDGFVWLDVTQEAKEIFSSGALELYVLYGDDTESLIESVDEINEALELELTIAVEGGHLKSCVPFNDADKKLIDGYWYIKMTEL